MSDEARRPMEVKCKCGHQWVAAWLPMEMGRIAKLLKNIACPMCGSDSRSIYLPTGPKNTVTMTVAVASGAERRAEGPTSTDAKETVTDGTSGDEVSKNRIFWRKRP